MGATLEASGRAKFDMMFRGLLDKEFPEKVSCKILIFEEIIGLRFHVSVF